MEWRDKKVTWDPRVSGDLGDLWASMVLKDLRVPRDQRAHLERQELLARWEKRARSACLGLLGTLAVLVTRETRAHRAEMARQVRRASAARTELPGSVV